MSEAKQVIAEVVSVGEDESNDALVAFIQTVEKSQSVGHNDLDEELEQNIKVLPLPKHISEQISSRLPGYMVPGVFFQVTGELPRMLSSGKVDRKRIRETGVLLCKRRLAEMKSEKGKKRSPMTEAERKLQNAWARVLNIDNKTNIGLDDSFFKLGGDSILAMRLAEEARRSSMTLTVAEIFNAPTLEAQAKLQTNIFSSEGIEEIPPFSLLGRAVEVTALCSDIALSSGLSTDASTIEDVYPCTPLQEGLFSLGSKKSGDYMAQHVLTLSSDIDLGTFKAAWEETTRRTPILRTRMIHHNELGLVQMVLRQGIEWNYVRNLDSYLDVDKATQMSLGEPLVRFALVEESRDQASHFVLTMHHALYDGFSIPLMMGLADRMYSGIGLASQPVPFKAFVKYFLDLGKLEADFYWASALAENESTPFPTLPSNIREPASDTTMDVECELWSRRGTHWESDITTPTIIRAALALLISRTTSSRDVVFGATLSGRTAPVAGVTSIVGPTISTVPVRILVDAPAKNSAASFLRSVQKQAITMIAHEQCGLQNIARLSKAAQHACQFQTLLVVQTGDDDSMPQQQTFGEWTSSHEQLGFTTYAVTLECFIGSEGVKIKTRFDSRVVSSWKMERMLGQLRCIMRQLADFHADPHRKLADVDLLTVEDQEILRTWNSKSLKPPVEQCVHEMIKEHAKIRPEATAVAGWDGQFTHAELDVLSDRVSRYLMNCGVRPEVIVPLCFPKSAYTIVAMVAVMKAGGAFVLLDPTHPIERLRTICERSGAQVAVATTSTASKILDLVQDVVVLEKQMEIELPLSGSWSCRVDPSNSAYVIFTSVSVYQQPTSRHQTDHDCLRIRAVRVLLKDARLNTVRTARLP